MTTRMSVSTLDDLVLDQQFVISITYPNSKAEFTLGKDGERLVRGRRDARRMNRVEAENVLRTTVFRGAETRTIVPVAA